MPRDGRDLVTGEIYRDGKYHDFAMFADRPFNVSDVHAASVVAFLEQTKQAHPDIRYRYLWWEGTPVYHHGVHHLRHRPDRRTVADRAESAARRRFRPQKGG